jgi:hypothetical protein
MIAILTRPICRRGLARLLLVSAAVSLVGCATLGARTPPPVTVSEVVQMSQAGVPADTIIKKMRDSGMVYRLTASQLVHLHDEGVPDAVLDYMQQTYLQAVRREQALEDWDHWAFGPDGFWYGGWPRAWRGFRP